MRTVVLVGMRRAAIESAARMSLRPILVAETLPSTRSRPAHTIEASFDAPPEAWKTLAADLKGEGIDAVVALTERSVVPAAHLRAALGLGGLSPEAARLCTHKGAMKRAIRTAGLPCADFVEASEGLTRDELFERLGLPLVVKPCVGSGGRGARIAREASEVPETLEDEWMAEAFIHGTEMSAEGLGWGGQMRAMNPTRYLAVGEASVVPAPLAAPEEQAVRDLHAAAWRALGVERGLTHMEAFLTPEGPVFGELAARPPGGHLMRLMALAYEMDPWELAFRVECGEHVELPQPRQAAAVQILHPGEGIVRVASGVETVRELPGVTEVTLRVQPGDRVDRREGTGQEVGHLIVTAPTATEAEARLRVASEALRLEITPDPGHAPLPDVSLD